MARKKRDTYERQASAIIAKALANLENIEELRQLSPFRFDELRRVCIKAVWDGYAVGRTKGINESKDAEAVDEQVHSIKYRAVGS